MRNDPNFKCLEIILRQLFTESLESFKKEQTTLLDGTEPLLTIDDIAKKFQVSKATVHNWKNKGSIVGKKFGKNRYFTQTEVRESMARYGYSKQWEGRTEF